MGLRNPTQGPRIVPFLVDRTSSDVLPNGRPAFRVTQRFGDPDRYFPGQHGAIDQGNYNCGDAMLASVAGTVRNVKDVYGALITEVIESSGARVGYGHLSRFAQDNGAQVSAGAVIGYVGDTGLGGVCHCHFYRRDANNRLLDPWPLLDQNIAAPRLRGRLNGNGINVRDTAGRVGGAYYGTIYATSLNGRIRRSSDGADLGAVTSYYAARTAIHGARHGIGPYPDQWVPLFLGGYYRHVARPLISFGSG